MKKKVMLMEKNMKLIEKEAEQKISDLLDGKTDQIELVCISPLAAVNLLEKKGAFLGYCDAKMDEEWSYSIDFIHQNNSYYMEGKAYTGEMQMHKKS